jgi:hypothetical protein
MKRHFAFPPVEDLDSWKNEYTGATHQAADAQEAAKQSVKNNPSKEGLERRNAFFQGSSKPKHVDRYEGEQEAEVVKPVDSRKEMLKNASKYIGSSFHSSEKEFSPKEEKPIQFQRSFTFTRGNHSSKEVHFQKDDVLSQEAKETKTIKYKVDVDLPKREEKSSTDSYKASIEAKERNLKLDLLGEKAGGKQNDFQAFSHYTEDIHVMDLVMDVLNDSRGLESSSSTLATEIVDYAKQLKEEQSLQKEIQKQMVGRLQESMNESFDLDFKDSSIVYDSSVHRVAADVQALIQKTHSIEWKNDPVVQERAGLWALHVAAKRSGIPANNINSSFKKKSLQAFGRLALQLLSTATAKQTNQVVQKEDNENTFVKGTASGVQKSLQQKFSNAPRKQEILTGKETVKQGIIKSVTSLKIDAENLLKSSDCVEDLQTMQNGIELDLTADEVLDAFVETLRNDELDLDSADSRLDIFTGTLSAKEDEHQVKFKSDRFLQRNTNDHVLKNEKVSFSSNVTFKEDVQGPQSIPSSGGNTTAKSAVVKFKEEKENRFKNRIHFDEGAEEENTDLKIIEKIVE